MKEDGHHIVVVIKERSEVMKMLERVVLSEEMARKKNFLTIETALSSSLPLGPISM